MTRPIEAFVHADALAANLARLRRAAAGARVFAIVKADAYGHGIGRVFESFRGADGFALLDPDEAVRVRDLGWRGPVLLLEGCFDARDLDLCSRLSLWHTVHAEEQIDRLAAHKTDRPHRVVLKVDTGMSRLGVPVAAARAAWLRLDALPQVESIVLATHFANADAGEGDAAIAEALRAFESAVGDLPGERSLANSAATLRFAESRADVRGDWVRPGIALYGSSPDAGRTSAAGWGLAPTMTLRAALIAVRELPAGASVGYGSVFTAERPMRIGTVACGYADGYPRVAPGSNAAGTPVLVDGVRTRTVGRVSMDMVAVDLAPVPSATVGSEVVLWGRATNGAVLSVDEVAAAAGTLGYELLCARAPRVPTRVVA